MTLGGEQKRKKLKYKMYYKFHVKMNSGKFEILKNMMNG